MQYETCYKNEVNGWGSTTETLRLIIKKGNSLNFEDRFEAFGFVIYGSYTPILKSYWVGNGWKRLPLFNFFLWIKN